MSALQFFAALNWAEWVLLCILFGLFDFLAISLALAVSALAYRSGRAILSALSTEKGEGPSA